MVILLERGAEQIVFLENKDNLLLPQVLQLRELGLACLPLFPLLRQQLLGRANKAPSPTMISFFAKRGGKREEE